MAARTAHAGGRGVPEPAAGAAVPRDLGYRPPRCKGDLCFCPLVSATSLPLRFLAGFSVAAVQ